MLLDRVSEVLEDPFPHVVIENALDDKYYRGLLETRPQPEDILRGRKLGPNQRLDLPTELATSILHPQWIEFCTYHSSWEFWDRIVEVFRKTLGIYDLNNNSIRLRCQPGLNTPTEGKTKVRGPHLDNPRELFAGLFYMPTDEDGGDLELYRWKERKFYGKLEVPEDCVEWVKTVPYKSNTYVMFLNTENSLHGVTPRKSKHYRNLVNIVVDARKPLFRVGHNGY